MQEEYRVAVIAPRKPGVESSNISAREGEQERIPCVVVENSKRNKRTTRENVNSS